MAQVSVNIRMDSDVKKAADSLFRELGINMTTAVNMFMRQSLRKRAIPFSIAADAVPRRANPTKQKTPKGEYYNEEGLLVREGYTIPRGEENDPFYSAKNLRELIKGAREADEGKYQFHELIEV